MIEKNEKKGDTTHDPRREHRDMAFVLSMWSEVLDEVLRPSLGFLLLGEE